MSRRIRTYMLWLLLAGTMGVTHAQEEKWVEYDRDYVFVEGIYPDREAFLSNNPIRIEQILTTEDKEAPDFYDRLLQRSSFRYLTEDSSFVNVYMDQIFGMYRGDKLFIRAGNQFVRVIQIGTISTFVVQMAQASSGPDWGVGMGPWGMGVGVGINVTPQNGHPVQYGMDVRTGYTIELNHQTVRQLIQDDPAMLEEYDSLKKRQRKELFMAYIRTYNESHPLMLPAPSAE